MNIREKILNGVKLKTEAINVFGEDLMVRELTGCERDAFEASLTVSKGKTVSMNMNNVRAKLVVKSLFDLDGSRLFGDNDVDLVGGLPASDLDKVFEVAQRISGLKPEDIEDLTKN